MQQTTPWRVWVLAWGNVVIGVAFPIAAFTNILAALRVFTVDWAGESVVLTAILGAVLGFLHWSSGWGILRSRPWAYQRTCATEGMAFGYTMAGILEMATSGRDRSLLILIRHGSEDWWNWSFSHFQNSVFREFPIMAWCVLGIGTILRYPLPGCPKSPWDRITGALGMVFSFTVIGVIARAIHMGVDGQILSSQR